ncbi:MAG: succinylglutamate desuccinylase/aspartoacylase family protein [Rhodospirillales bacterium]|jgi:uncharacterized protein|nr:succinylglutamate desuccinylase/aspartoacylase family protein [Rhodospirillales bacterium]
MSRKTETIPLPATSPGTSRHLTVWRWGTPGARPKVYFQSALHADEWPGIMASHHLSALLDKAEARGEIQGEIIMLPYANPVGLSQSVNDRVLGRFRLADGGGNFNRDWPDLSPAVLEAVRDKLGNNRDENLNIMRKALLEVVSKLPEESEKDAHRKALLGLSVDSDYVFDLHCDWEAMLHLYSHAEHEDITMELACDMGVPVVMLDTGLVGGPFDETHANPWVTVRKELGLNKDALPPACFSTTVELRGQCDVSDELGSLDAANMYRFLIRRGVISGDADDLPKALCKPSPLDAIDMFTAPREGLIAWKKQLGDIIEVGDLLAELIDITEPDLSKARTPVYAQQSGLLFAVHTDRLVRPGTIMGKISGHEPLAHRQGAQLLSN